MNGRRAAGADVERAARAYLEAAGLRLVAANVGYRGGELDLVMLDGDGPIALYAPAPDMAANHEEELRRIAAEGIYPAWHWPAGVFDMPELPRRVDHGART